MRRVMRAPGVAERNSPGQGHRLPQAGKVRRARARLKSSSTRVVQTRRCSSGARFHHDISRPASISHPGGLVMLPSRRQGAIDRRGDARDGRRGDLVLLP